MIIQPKLFSPTGSKQRKHFFKTYEKFPQGIERLPFDNIIGGKKPPPTAGHELPRPRSQFAVQPWSYMPSISLSLPLLLFYYLSVSSALPLPFFLGLFCCFISFFSLFLLLFYYLTFSVSSALLLSLFLFSFFFGSLSLYFISYIIFPLGVLYPEHLQLAFLTVSSLLAA